MTTIREIRRDVDILKEQTHIVDNDKNREYQKLIQTLIEYSRTQELLSPEEQHEVAQEVAKAYGERRGRFSDVPTKK